MIDARGDMAGALNAIQETLQATHKMIAAIYQERTLSIREIAERRGVAVSTLYDAPWRLPNFGQPDFNSTPRRWKLSTVDAWEAIPEATRRREWDTMPTQERKRILEAVA